jgi:hypothetical protein
MRMRRWCAFCRTKWMVVWTSSRRSGRACRRSFSLLVKVRFFSAHVVFERWAYGSLVVNMAKAKQWEDVRLLSFDLQTVEFTYASVRDTPPAPQLLSHLIATHHRTTRSPYPAKTNSSQAAHTASNSGVSRSQHTPGTTPAQTHTPKPSPSSTPSSAKAASPTPYQHSYPSSATPYQSSKYSRAYTPPPLALYRKLQAGGA